MRKCSHSFRSISGSFIDRSHIRFVRAFAFRFRSLLTSLDRSQIDRSTAHLCELVLIHHFFLRILHRIVKKQQCYDVVCYNVCLLEAMQILNYNDKHKATITNAETILRYVKVVFVSRSVININMCEIRPVACVHCAAICNVSQR